MDENYQSSHIEIVISLLEAILNLYNAKFIYSGSFKNNKLRFYQGKTETYFAYRTFDNVIGEAEFQNAIKDFDTFKTHINKWNENGMVREFIIQCKEQTRTHHFETSPKILSDENKKKLIKGIFYFGQINPKNFSYNYYDLINLFSFTDKNDMEIFARQIFEEAVYPYWFESDFLQDLNEMPNDEFVITKQERYLFLLNYLRKIAEESSLYYNPKNSLPYLIGWSFKKTKINNQYTKEAKDIMIDFIGNKDLAGALQSFIQVDRGSFTLEVKYSITTYFLSFFDTFENFESFLKPFREDKNNPNYKLVEEFWAFYQCSKNEDGTFKYIEYDKFEVLKPTA